MVINVAQIISKHRVAATNSNMGVALFATILLSWFGGVRYFKNIPAGLIAIAVKTLIAWG